MNYYISRNGQSYGPYSEETIQKYLNEGSMQASDLARTDATSDWTPLGQLMGRAAPQHAAKPSPIPESPPAKPAPAVSQVPPHVASQPASFAAPAAHVPGPSHHAASTANMSKRQYLDSIRADTAYPTYRGFIGVIAILGYIVAGLVALGSLGTGMFSIKQSPAAGVGIMVGGLIYAAILFLMAKFFKEAALILADIGDSTVDANSRTRAGQ
jgi:hypothetical protein